jgi:hypothetical protein
MKLNKIIYILCLLSIILSIVSVSAVGVTPGRRIIDFSPSQETMGSFKIINSENRQLSLTVEVRGDLSDDFIISETNLVVDANQEKVVDYTINLPKDLSPGTHVQEIVILEKMEDSENFIGAVAGVITQVYVRVPYPGKYADVDLNIESAESGQDILFSVVVSNIGKEDINGISATIDIYNSNKNKIEIISLNKMDVPMGNKKESSISWFADVAAGEYYAEATISYGSEIVSIGKKFSVGKEVLDLNSVTVKDFSLGGIAKFEMDIQNKWAEDIKNVYSQTNVFDSNKKMIADFKSPTYDIYALNKQTLFSYWDTEGTSEGIYDAVIYLRYGEKFSKKSVQFEVGKNSLRTMGLGYVISEKGSNGKGDNLTFFLIIVIVILVLLNLLWFIVFRKKMKK